eukprot:gene20313-22312_t
MTKRRCGSPTPLSYTISLHARGPLSVLVWFGFVWGTEEKRVFLLDDTTDRRQGTEEKMDKRGKEELEFVAQDETYCTTYDVYRRGLLEQQRRWVSKQLIPILSESFQKPSYRILAVGSGEGDVDILILDEINKELAKHGIKCDISYTVIERNQSFVKRFQERVEHHKHLSNVKFQWFEGTFEEVIGGNEGPSLGTFDLVHFVHALYYVDAENVLKYCMDELLMPTTGFVMAVVQTEQSIYAKNCRKFKGYLPNCFDGFTVFTDETLKPIADKNGWKCKVEVGDRILDISDILGDQLDNNDGNKLLDFFFHADGLKKSLTPSLWKEIMDHFKENSTFENGRYKSVGHEAILLFSK